MALPGEVVGKSTTKCCCGKRLTVRVLRSAAGYYIGFLCDDCGPYSRESGYYPKMEVAQKALDSGDFDR